MHACSILKLFYFKLKKRIVLSFQLTNTIDIRNQTRVNQLNNIVQHSI